MNDIIGTSYYSSIKNFFSEYHHPKTMGNIIDNLMAFSSKNFFFSNVRVKLGIYNLCIKYLVIHTGRWDNSIELKCTKI